MATPDTTEEKPGNTMTTVRQHPDGGFNVTYPSGYGEKPTTVHIQSSVVGLIEDTIGINGIIIRKTTIFEER